MPFIQTILSRTLFHARNSPQRGKRKVGLSAQAGLHDEVDDAESTKLGKTGVRRSQFQSD